MTLDPETRTAKKSTNVRYAGSRALWIRGMRVLDRVAPVTSTRVVEDLFLHPRRPRRPVEERILLEGATVSTVYSQGHFLKTWSWGQGPVVLLVHGWEGRGSQLAHSVTQLTEAGFRVVAFDGPAHGDSEGERCSVFDLANAVRDVAGAVGPVHLVVAHSFGAMATAVALRRGLRVRRALFLAPGALSDDAPHRFARLMGVPTAPLKRIFWKMDDRHGIHWTELRYSRIGRGLTTPLLVIHDLDDDEVPLWKVRQLVDHWPGATLRLTEGLGHRRLLRHPSVIDRVVSYARWGLAGPEIDTHTDPWTHVLQTEGLRMSFR